MRSFFFFTIIALLIANLTWTYFTPKRWMPGHPVTFYVDHSHGNDNNNGLSPTRAFATIQHAIGTIQNKLDCSGQSPLSTGGGPTIQLAAETFTEDNVTVFGSDGVGCTEIVIHGSLNEPDKTVWQVDGNAAALQTRDGGIVTIQGIKFSALGSGSQAVSVGQMSVLDFDDIDWGNFPDGIHIYIDQGGAVNCLDTPTSHYTISGDAYAHVRMVGPAKFSIGSPNVTIAGPIKMGAFYLLLGNATVTSGQQTFSGALVGTQYIVDSNSVFYQGGTVLPGNYPGIALHGGQVL